MPYRDNATELLYCFLYVNDKFKNYFYFIKRLIDVDYDYMP